MTASAMRKNRGSGRATDSNRLKVWPSPIWPSIMCSQFLHLLDQCARAAAKGDKHVRDRFLDRISCPGITIGMGALDHGGAPEERREAGAPDRLPHLAVKYESERARAAHTLGTVVHRAVDTADVLLEFAPNETYFSTNQIICQLLRVE